LAGYAWAGPNSALGLALGFLMLLLGGRARLHEGVAEFHGGLVGVLLTWPRIACPFRAVTLGHVVLATDASSLARSRDHERVHVRQYEKWGPFFLPAYFASGLWQLACGRRCYRDNYFERQAAEESSTRF